MSPGARLDPLGSLFLCPPRPAPSDPLHSPTLESLAKDLLEGLLTSKATMGGLAPVIAIVLLIASRWLLPQEHRAQVKLPALLLILHVILLLFLVMLPDSWPLYGGASLLALFLALLSAGRSSFLLLIDAVLMRRFSQNIPKIFRDIIQALIYSAVILITLRAAGVELSSLLTTSALLTAVIGLSLQETMGNMFAGLAIQAQRPFQVDDWIQVDDNERLAGRVVEINWRATKIFTTDDVELVVPNGILAKTPIRNYTKPTRASRREVFILLAYDIPPQSAQQALLEGIRGTPGVLEHPAPTVTTQELAESGVNYWCRYSINRFEDRYTIDGAVRDRLWYAANRARMKIPYPTRESYTNEVNESVREKARARDIQRFRGALEHVDIFTELPEAKKDELAQRIEGHTYGAKERIIHQGDEGDELFIVERGEVAIRVDRQGEQVEVARLGPGAFFGEMSLMTGERRAASVEAVTESDLVVVGKPAFQRIFQDSPDLAERISETLALRQEELENTSGSVSLENRALQARSQTLLLRIRTFFSLGS